MSEYSTSSPSIEQTRLYLIRPPSAMCTWWNRMSLSSVAEYSFTPMLTRPKDTAPRQIDRMPPLPHQRLRACEPRFLTLRHRQQVKISRIGAGGCPRQVDRPSVSPPRGTRPRGKTRRAWTALPCGARRRPSFSPARGLPVLAQPAVLDRVVEELEDVGARDGRHRQGGEPGGPRRGRVAEDEGGADPLGEAERTGEQLTHRMLDAAVLPDLLGDLRV